MKNDELPLVGERVSIPVAMLEFVVGGSTIWVHSPMGATVLRIKTKESITVDACVNNPVSHLDIITQDKIQICLADDYLEGK